MNKKLTDLDKSLILELVRERRKHLRIARNLSNKRIAEKFEVHPQTIAATCRGRVL